MAIVGAAIALGAVMGLDVIARGVEPAEPATTLAAFGCREAPTHLSATPVAAAAFRSGTASVSAGVAA